jgi:iron complex transport system permease protein
VTGTRFAQGHHLARRGRTAATFAGLTVVLLVAGLAALTVGSERLSAADITEALLGGGAPLTRTIIIELRLPRVLLGMLIGVALGTSGAAYQALFRNPLADPYVVGASSGAAAGAAAVIVTGWAGSAAGFGPASLGAFGGALLAVGLVYAIAATAQMPPISLLLVGTVVSTMLGAAVWLLMALADQQLHHIVGWLLGGLAGHGWDTVWAAAPLMLAGAFALCLLGRPLDALCGGEEAARAVGLWVGGATALVLGTASLAVATAVAAGGVIGFVGLVGPHVARPLVGVAHARLVPASGLVGALLLLGADALARSVAAPLELPIGTVTALLGGPFFLVVLRRSWASRVWGR